jgi:hypothetical protein
MKRPQPDPDLDDLVHLFEMATGMPVQPLENHPLFDGPESPDLILSSESGTFVVETKSSGNAAHVSMAARLLVSLVGEGHHDAIPVVVVPYMGEVGRRICRDEGVGWLDRSGNAGITAPGLRIRIEGRPNRFKRRGRPDNAFAPKSSRVARVLLTDPTKVWSQRSLAREAGMSEGYVSRVVRRLEADGLLARDKQGAVRASDPNVLLDAWSEAYDFSAHSIVKGHIPARTGEQLLSKVAAELKSLGTEWAFTGLSGAWLLAPFAGFRLVTVYVKSKRISEQLNRVGFRSEERGANLWLVSPNDRGVFFGQQRVRDFECVSAVQVYLDLAAHPERAEEAASELRTQLLSWKTR